jgi:predicted lactoylglutathione lyase
MNKQIFVNLPVRDLKRSKAFFSALGYTFNAQFTDEKAACLEIGENIYAMLLTPSLSLLVSPASPWPMRARAPR